MRNAGTLEKFEPFCYEKERQSGSLLCGLVAKSDFSAFKEGVITMNASSDFHAVPPNERLFILSFVPSYYPSYRPY
jgi:hypothetical protein